MADRKRKTIWRCGYRPTERRVGYRPVMTARKPYHPVTIERLERVISGVKYLISRYGTSLGLEADLRRLEQELEVMRAGPNDTTESTEE